MKGQKINPNTLNPMQMNSMTSMMGVMNSVQKIGKTKRKYIISLNKGNKKFLPKFIDEMRKQFSASPVFQGEGVLSFFEYLKKECDKKNKTEVRVSYEELEFLKKIIVDTIKGIEGMEFKWYQFLKRMMVQIMLKHYKNLLEEIKK